jgi:hypothetical protein
MKIHEIWSLDLLFVIRSTLSLVVLQHVMLEREKHLIHVRQQIEAVGNRPGTILRTGRSAMGTRFFWTCMQAMTAPTFEHMMALLPDKPVTKNPVALTSMRTPSTAVQMLATTSHRKKECRDDKQSIENLPLMLIVCLKYWTYLVEWLCWPTKREWWIADTNTWWTLNSCMSNINGLDHDSNSTKHCHPDTMTDGGNSLLKNMHLLHVLKRLLPHIDYSNE